MKTLATILLLTLIAVMALALVEWILYKVIATFFLKPRDIDSIGFKFEPHQVVNFLNRPVRIIACGEVWEGGAHEYLLADRGGWVSESELSCIEDKK